MDLEVGADVFLPLGAPRGDFAMPRVQRWNLSCSSLGEELPQKRARIGEDAEVRRIVPADLGVVDIDMHQLRRREVPRVARHPRRRRAIVEARADGDHEIGVPARLIGGISAVAADEAERQRIAHVEAAHAVRRADHGNAVLGRKLRELLASLGQRRAVADEEHGPARLRQKFNDSLNIFGRRAATSLIEAVPGLLELDLCFFLEQVVRHVEIDGPRPAAGRRRNGLPQGERQHVDARGLEASLHHRTHHIGEVGLVVSVQLLERAAVELRGRHVGGDREKCGGVSLRHGERHDEVRRARAGGRERGHRLVLDAEVAVGHVPGGLLVARRDEPHLVAHLVERIEQADVAVAADAEDVRDLLLDQEFGDQLAAFLRGALALATGRAEHAFFSRFVHATLLCSQV